MLHVIDFDQLKIENQQYLEKIEERNNELLRLKLTTGNTVQVTSLPLPLATFPSAAITSPATCHLHLFRPLKRYASQSRFTRRSWFDALGAQPFCSFRQALTVPACQVLNTLKHRLNNLTSESEWLKRETNQRKESLVKITEEISRVEQVRLSSGCREATVQLRERGSRTDARTRVEVQLHRY